ncbi:hypothetical protein MKJ01_09420 [Chryseobacterium sp. SSA4.19]|uniref:hypothetical protein n=1 Tax=Chryseobacterium sp. SSA4.19 TaxID=2919915 RepID=UPI001F4E8F09|nr:hypothetical protein [Chryseobacterium sp. SSA4.19]MCJ8153975.1 hypothetical protein [Chryseobacterium sp. SSA4.19]
MNHSKLTQKQILFLYAFLRQADRSLDKSRWTSLKELNAYYQNRIKPEQMIHYLKTHFNIVKKDIDLTNDGSSQRTVIDRVRTFFQQNHLTADELSCLYNLLLSFDQYLKSDSSYTSQTEILRIDIAKFYSRILAPKISSGNLKKLKFTEHYEQNRLAKPFVLNKVIPEDFYEKKIN